MIISLGVCGALRFVQIVSTASTTLQRIVDVIIVALVVVCKLINNVTLS